MLAGLVAIIGLMSLLILGMVRSGGRPGGLGINTKLGEVSVKQQSARDFRLELFGGDTVTLSDLRGRVVMVDFWASWCPPCREEAPTLAQVYKEYERQGVAFIGVDIWDSRDEALRFLDRYAVTYPNGLDEKGTIAIDYGVTGIPEKYLINWDGVLVKKFVGPMNDQKLRQVLDELLSAQSLAPSSSRP